ncbi:hypothetical protein TrVFT333_008105 [Trichoderma virens FT-333]|nr:hypothetical protein TrVFT333_008105 [Trichoderma virens FT-333]
MASSSITGLFSRLSLLSRTTPSTTTMTTPRLFSTTSSSLARKVPTPAGPPKPPVATAPPPNPKTSTASAPCAATCSRPLLPLRMARQRYLRHWTIHRAWMLFRRKQHEAIAKERSRMYAGMYNACEELRKTVGPGSRDEGYLYRVAMEKKGVYGLEGVPIEYARFQTDSPAKEPWNHDWKR